MSNEEGDHVGKIAKNLCREKHEYRCNDVNFGILSSSAAVERMKESLIRRTESQCLGFNFR